MKLPNGDKAEVDLRKLIEYCLSPVHPVGKHKATVFRSALGLTSTDAFVLREWLLRAAASEPIIKGSSNDHGDRYQIDFEVTTSSGRATIRSA